MNSIRPGDQWGQSSSDNDAGSSEGDEGGFPARLTRKDVQILTVLGKRPLDPINVLSKEAEMTTVTFAKRMNQMYQDGILIAVSAQIVYPSLDLRPYFFFVDTPFENIDVVEKAMDIHPYARYRARCLGATNGLLTLFAVPNGALPMLLEFFERLQDNGFINEYGYETAISSWSNSETDFSFYDIDEDTWGFDWDSWENSLSRTPSPLQDTPSALDKVDARDMRVLRQLTIDARDKKKNIAERSDVPNYFLTRRLKLYHKYNIIGSYRVIVHRNASRLFSTLSFVCRSPIDGTGMFSQAVPRLPFQSTLIPVTEGFILQISLPSLDLPALGRILQKHCGDVQVMWSDYSSSMRYWFWDVTFQGGRWVSNRKFMVDDVIDQLRTEK